MVFPTYCDIPSLVKKARKNFRVLVTGGPTRAYLDKVRFLTNVSSGALAFEICKRLCESKLDVALVSGPVSQPFEQLPLKELRRVETNDEMQKEVLSLCRDFKPNVAILSAAVLDFAPVKVEKGKVTSKNKEWVIRLKPTPKIIDIVGKRFPQIRRIGFKLEWKRPDEKETYTFAIETLEKKKLDALCLNFLSEIDTQSHPALFATRDGAMHLAQTKQEIAALITDYVGELVEGM